MDKLNNLVNKEREAREAYNRLGSHIHNLSDELESLRNKAYKIREYISELKEEISKESNKEITERFVKESLELPNGWE